MAAGPMATRPQPKRTPSRPAHRSAAASGDAVPDGACAERSSTESQSPPRPVSSARELRLARIVESFLEHIRRGGALDVAPFVDASKELGPELEPLLMSVLRMEGYAERFEQRRSGR